MSTLFYWSTNMLKYVIPLLTITSVHANTLEMYTNEPAYRAANCTNIISMLQYNVVALNKASINIPNETVTGKTERYSYSYEFLPDTNGLSMYGEPLTPPKKVLDAWKIYVDKHSWIITEYSVQATLLHNYTIKLSLGGTCMSPTLKD